MTESNHLSARFPAISDRLPRIELCTLPTRIDQYSLTCFERPAAVWVKHDDASGAVYGGNKVRKLEYLLGRVMARRYERVGTFGTVGSNHALATALYARHLGLEPLCFLSHQTRTPLAAKTLRAHLSNGSELVPFGGGYAERLRTLREHLWQRRTAIVPMGGSSWLGTLGFVNAGLELAEQMGSGRTPTFDRVYMATGTMGSAAGVAIGLALAGATTELHAVRVSHETIASPHGFSQLVAKTCSMLTRVADSFPSDTPARVRVAWHHDYFAPGYARGNEKTERALSVAAADIGLTLEHTYTGKAFAAVLDHLADRLTPGHVLFWNTYHSAEPPNASVAAASQLRSLPDEFGRYLSV